MSVFLQLAINILIPTALFGLVAAGFTLFCGVSRVLHLTIGASVTAAGYVFAAAIKAGFSIPIAILCAVVSAIAIGLFANTVLYEPLRAKGRFSVTTALIASLALLLGIQSVFLIVFGSQPKSIDLPFLQTRFDFFGASITLTQLLSLAIAAIVCAGFSLYLRYCRLGVALRATSDNPEVAEIVGINTKRIRALAITLASLLAGIGGILIALEYNLEPHAAATHAIRAFSRTIVGGVGSIPGVIVSGLLIESGENLGAFFISSSYQSILTFTLIFLFLIFRPQGIFGSRKE